MHLDLLNILTMFSDVRFAVQLIRKRQNVVCLVILMNFTDMLYNINQNNLTPGKK